MEDEREIQEAKAFATGYYQGAQFVTEYMKGQHCAIDAVLVKPETGYRDAALKGLWMRAYAWMQTIVKLDDPLDFQAISAGNRALLEIIVDMLLLHHDKTNACGWKIFQWNVSEKMKSAELLVDFYHNKGIPVPGVFEAQRKFYENDKSMVDHMRRTLWPNQKDPRKASHPKRWTGSGNLFDDIDKVDELYGSVVKDDIGSTLTEYYRTEYRKMNWHIHSGVSSFWDLPPQAFHLICGSGFKVCADFGMLCTKIILMDFGFDLATDDLRQKWEEVQNHRDIVTCEGLGIVTLDDSIRRLSGIIRR